MSDKTKRIEDLNLETKEAAEVKGGGVIVDDKSLNFTKTAATNAAVNPGNVGNDHAWIFC